jgi:hypothetical protein
MAISATLAKQYVDAALQFDDAQTNLNNWFSSASVAQQVASALASQLNFLSPRQRLGVLNAHAGASATPIKADGTNLSAFLGFVTLLAAAAQTQNTNSTATNAVAFDLVSQIVTNLK